MAVLDSNAWAAVAGAEYPYACLLIMAMSFLLQLPVSQRRLPRTILGGAMSSFVLVTHPLVYASKTQVFGPALAFYSCEVALAILHLTFMEPLGRKLSLMDVVGSHLQHSMHGVRKVYQRTLQKEGKAGRNMPAKTEAPAGDAQRQSEPAVADSTHKEHWVFAVLRALEAVVRVSLMYDAAFCILCNMSSFCEPGNISGVLQPVSLTWAAASGG